MPSKELIERVWSSVALERSAVPGAVKKLRSSLGHARDAIATVRGYGFRFAAPVTELSAPALLPSSLPVLRAEQTSLPTLVVIPFRVLGELDRELAPWIAEDLGARLHEYRIATVLAPELGGWPVAQSAGASGSTCARYLMRGALSRCGRGLAALASLVDAHHARLVWSLRVAAAEPEPARAIAALCEQIASALGSAFLFGSVPVPCSCGHEGLVLARSSIPWQSDGRPAARPCSPDPPS